MRHIPILRGGEPYTSVETTTLVHHATSEIVAEVSQANSGMVRRDILHMDDRVLERFSVRELMAMSRKAADLFVHADLPLGDGVQSFDDYIAELSATTGMPVGYCRRNAEKIRKVLDEIEPIVRGLTRGFDLAILDTGYGTHAGGTLSFFREGRRFGAVLPSNSPGVHSLWIPAIVLKAPVVLKPGREEPWTPMRIIQAFLAAGCPPAAFGFYPTSHEGAGAILELCGRACLFGDESTTAPYVGRTAVNVHGPGRSKVVLGADVVDDWRAHLDVLVGSVVDNGGRSCINASSIFVPRHADAIADALAAELGAIRPTASDDPAARLSAIANPKYAEFVDATIERGLAGGGATDVTAAHRAGPRHVERDGSHFLLPTVVRCDSVEHALARTEFMFPFVSVVEVPPERLVADLGPSLVVTAITRAPELVDALLGSTDVDRVNLGPVRTSHVEWDQPHEGNLFEFLWKRRPLERGW
ncbi:MAG: aldehyde dehydrogenase [Verrucomicrobiae bacterium]|nr:aldehyde dehydrogenase [Verrucomicrobiae bacterium]